MSAPVEVLVVLLLGLASKIPILSIPATRPQLAARERTVRSARAVPGHPLVATVAALLLVVSCASRHPDRDSVRSADTGRHATRAFLEERRGSYESALVRARAWLDRLEVDPVALRAHGIKGKKKLTELLDTYYRLWRVADPTEREALMTRIREVVSVTYESRYHDLATVTDTEFKQDATSYLRTALLMERLGLDTRIYRDEIVRVHPRLNAHMPSRGPHQRLAFHHYYRHFGLAEPFPLRNALAAGVIARRVHPSRLDRMGAYELTHEVFVPYDFGDRMDVADPFDGGEPSYLRSALRALVVQYIDQRDADLVAELVTCLRMLQFVDLPEFRRGLDYLLSHQNENGSWGDFRRAARAFGRYGNYGLILHTTEVVIHALTGAFHEPWNLDLYRDAHGR